MKKRSRESLPPDITPLIDVVFLLLIFFMVSTVFKKDEMALLLNLPKTQKGQKENEQKKKKTILIELNTTQIAFNGKKIELDKVEDQLKLITDKSTPVELRIDKQVKYDRVVQLLDKLKKFDLTNLSLITDS